MKRSLFACVVCAVLTILAALLLDGPTATEASSPRSPGTSVEAVVEESRTPERTAVVSRELATPTLRPIVGPDLRAEPPLAFVYGTVVGRDGLPVRDVHVRFSSLERGAGWERPREFDCDPMGFYAGDLQPGTWMASVVLGVSNQAPQRDDAWSAANHPLCAFVQPLPRIDTLAARTSTEFSFRFGAGRGAIDGRVVDEREQPFAGLEVYLAIKELENAATGELYAMGLSSLVSRQVTDEQGRFRCEGLEPATYTVAVAPEGFNPTAAPGESKVGQRVPLQDVLVGSGRVSLELTAHRPHPVRIDGCVAPCASWASLTLILPANDQGRVRDRRTSVPIAEDGSFSIYVEGQELSAILELSGRETTTVPLAISPADEAFFITISIR